MSTLTKEDMETSADGILDQSYCTAIEHLFSPASRDLIGRYLGNFCDQLVITPTELVHSAKYQKRLHDAGRTLMNVVDKIGTMQARHKGESHGKRVKELHDLISAASRKVWDDEKDKPSPTIKPEGFRDYVAGLKVPEKDRDYVVNRTLSEFLFQHKVWKEKVAVLVKLVNLTKDTDEFRYVEPVLGECLRSEPCLDQLLGMAERTEVRCNDLVDLWKGEWEPRDTAVEVMSDVNALIASGNAPNVKAAMEYSLLRTLAGKMPLRSAEPEIEIQAVFDLFRRMWTGNSLIGGAKALALLEKRQGRHVNQEGVTDLLRERKVLADRIAYLMSLTQLAIGTSNRAILKTFIQHYFGDRDFGPRVIAGQDSPVPKMQTLTLTHRALRSSWLSDDEKGTYGALVEQAQGELIKRSRLFEQVEKKGGGPSQKVLTLLDLCRKGTFIDGPNLEAVRKVMQTYLQDPSFLPDYLSGATGEERDRKIALLVKTLAAFGIRFG